MSFTKYFGIALFGLCSNSDVRAQQLVKAGYEVGQPQLMWIENGTFEAKGALPDLFAAIARDVGFKVEWHPMIPADRMALHAAKIIDASLGQFSPDRAAAFDFADPVYVVGDAVYVRKEDPSAYRNIEDLKDAIVTAPAGGGLTELVQKAGAGIFKELRVLVAPRNFQAVISGEANAGFLNNLSLAERISRGSLPELRMVTTYESRFKNPGGFMFAKGNEEMVKKTNLSLQKLKTDGTAKSIFAKYGIEFVLVK